MKNLFVKAKDYEGEQIFTKIENFDFIICRNNKIYGGFNELCLDGVYNIKLKSLNKNSYDDFFNIILFEIEYDNFNELKENLSNAIYLDGEYYKMIYFEKSIDSKCASIREGKTTIDVVGYLDNPVNVYKNGEHYFKHFYNIARFPHPGIFKLSAL